MVLQKLVQHAGVRKRLARDGVLALTPTKEGKWRRPSISNRKANVARKQAIVAGTYGSFDPERGGWLPEWDKVRSPQVLRPMREHKQDRTRPERAAVIRKNLKDMPAKIAAYRKEVKKRKPPPGIESLLKRLALKPGKR